MIIYTDGACSGNGKANNSGGYGVVVYNDDCDTIVRAYSEKETNTTNNRMELKAILWAYAHYGIKPDQDWDNQIPIVYSDSNYCVQTFTNWMFGWAKNGWIKSDKKIPENLDLIKQYYDLYNKGYRIDLRKVKGHAGEEGNEIADALATGHMTPEDVYKNYNSIIDVFNDSGMIYPITSDELLTIKGE